MPGHIPLYVHARNRLSSPSPIETPELTFWMDLSDPTTVTHTGGDVTAIADKSASGFDLSLKSGTPRYGDVSLNGIDVLTLANGEALQHTPISDGLLVDKYMSMYAVFKAVGGATYDAAPCVLSSVNYGRPFDRYNNTWHVEQTNVGTFTDIGAANTWRVMSWHGIDGVTAGLPSNLSYFAEYTNGVLDAEFSNAIAFNNGLLNLGVGQRQDSVTQFIGDIAEILIYNTDHDTSIREGITQTLMAKYAIV